MPRLPALIFTIFSSLSADLAIADRGPAYDTRNITEQQKQAYYKFQTSILAHEQKKERDFRREIANLPDGIKQRAVLIAAGWLAELQLNLQSDKFQSKWADGVDAQRGTATMLMHYTMSLNALASDAKMPAAAGCHTYEMARLRELAIGKQLLPGIPCREAAYGESLIDATTAAGDRAVPPDVYAIIEGWTKAVTRKSLAAISADGFLRIGEPPKSEK